MVVHANYSASDASSAPQAQVGNLPRAADLPLQAGAPRTLSAMTSTEIVSALSWVEDSRHLSLFGQFAEWHIKKQQAWPTKSTDQLKLRKEFAEDARNLEPKVLAGLRTGVSREPTQRGANSKMVCAHNAKARFGRIPRRATQLLESTFGRENIKDPILEGLNIAAVDSSTAQRRMAALKTTEFAQFVADSSKRSGNTFTGGYAGLIESYLDVEHHRILDSTAAMSAYRDIRQAFPLLEPNANGIIPILAATMEPQAAGAEPLSLAGMAAADSGAVAKRFELLKRREEQIERAYGLQVKTSRDLETLNNDGRIEPLLTPAASELWSYLGRNTQTCKNGIQAFKSLAGFSSSPRRLLIFGTMFAQRRNNSIDCCLFSARICRKSS